MKWWAIYANLPVSGKLEKLVNFPGSKEILRKLLMVSEIFWIQKIKLLVLLELTVMLLIFRLILNSLKQLSRDINNDIMVKQYIFDVK